MIECRIGEGILSSDTMVTHRDVDQTMFDYRRFPIFHADLFDSPRRQLLFRIYFLEVRVLFP